jgi:ankyrin repeat protein
MEDQFIELIQYGNLEKIQKFYNNNPSIDISADNEYAFCHACGDGLLELAKWLLEIKPDIDISAEGDIAFFSACRYKNTNVALWLATLDTSYVVVIKDDVIVDYYVK